jgi:hypothetical protein
VSVTLLDSAVRRRAAHESVAGRYSDQSLATARIGVTTAAAAPRARPREPVMRVSAMEAREPVALIGRQLHAGEVGIAVAARALHQHVGIEVAELGRARGHDPSDFYPTAPGASRLWLRLRGQRTASGSPKSRRSALTPHHPAEPSRRGACEHAWKRRRRKCRRGGTRAASGGLRLPEAACLAPARSGRRPRVRRGPQAPHARGVGTGPEARVGTAAGAAGAGQALVSEGGRERRDSSSTVCSARGITRTRCGVMDLRSDVAAVASTPSRCGRSPPLRPRFHGGPNDGGTSTHGWHVGC